MGAVGDYNGDGADDVVAGTMGEIPLIILAGSRDWRLSAPKEPIPQVFDYSLKAFPNPFNQSATIKFNLPVRGDYHLEVFDLTGRSVAMLQSGSMDTGEHSFEWRAPTAGIFWIRLSSDKGLQAIAKAVCLP